MAKRSEHQLGISISDDYDFTHSKNGYERTPEQKLLVGFLERTILDYITIKCGGYIQGTEVINGYRENITCPVEYVHRNSRRDKTWSLLWVLSHLYEHPEHMKEHIIEKMEELIKKRSLG